MYDGNLGEIDFGSVSDGSSYWELTVHNLILQYAWSLLKPQQNLLFTF